MLYWLILVVLFCIALVIVIKSANVFVDNLVEMGRFLGISPIILGVTVAAAGTSLPEFGSAIISVFTGNPDMGVGVVIGSNIWNICGIIGVSALLPCVITTNQEEIKRDGFMGLLAALVLATFMLLGFINQITALVLILMYGAYLYFLIKNQQKYYNIHHHVDKTPDKPFNYKQLVGTILGFIGLIISCRLLVYSAVELAQLANIPEMIVGLFALAIGTSLAEMVVAITSAMKKMCSLSLGTILGSNIFNILMGIGIPALFIEIPVDPLSVVLDAPVLIVVTLLLLYFMRSDMKLTRREGSLLLGIYGVYAFLRIAIFS
ncbi:MAG: calcium/sodium antiporter [Euryarchaeota archaeon]|nr:calcium/sodium antiporter [Euryarchaeota archaeon]MBU4607683.1 calcium/sodium antiporter [Euryarchaeota archaeon]MBV1730420.1 calcium/sodium antiporter [Methanobacterium sp.]MBV1755066.1 calcium/sodium antiporter [Methanobacterium sp.]